MSFLLALFGIKPVKNDSITVLTPVEFKLKVVHNNVQLVDVRTLKEYKSGHIKGSKNIDFFSSKFNIEFDKMNKQKPVYVYCRSGSRSRQTSKKLYALGFAQIYDLKGGIINYN
ncbi:rhodanese-like domain-containing protein [Psychroserpens burtonensis]|uniref:Rhodanese-like domain-containing protein n=1 Tax=Psychroserpens burtonensis TaxID=49278 RepID=A0A5C7B760_9FLAO|nr:rhodanese-like domain-containing protein [Psychroserpens burtonensis]TXE16744.1 rhodanese-like domain-containing protein [Psychroserpens burtonensis]